MSKSYTGDGLLAVNSTEERLKVKSNVEKWNYNGYKDYSL